MDARAKEALRIGNGLFGKKGPVDTLMQEIALNFYTKRATFTYKRDEGEEFADHLFSSYPERARQELGNILPEYLRPGKWLSIHADDDEIDEGDAERAFLERLTDIQWRAMNAKGTNITRATLQTDHDFAAFGNAVLKYGVNVDANGLLFRNYHIRDCAWSENAEGTIDAIHRKWNPTARQLKQTFPKTISGEVEKACKTDPEKPFNCRHIVLPSRIYDYKTKNGRQFPFVSLYVEEETETLLEEVGQNYFGYVVPRWQTVSDSVFGVSMTTSILLPDGRTLQAIMRTLREAGEKYVDPPMIAVADAIRGDLALYAGGVTTADIEYDERLGEVLRPITRDRGGMPIGFEIAEALKEDIRSGFFLDKIQLPETNSQMTATEVRRRIQEHIRSASPISRPIQEDYNEPLCDGLFQLLSDFGAFPLDQMPDSLQGHDVKFKFRSPTEELQEQNEAELFLDGRDRILFPALQIDPSLAEIADMAEGTRDALRAMGWKQTWLKPKEAIEAKRAEMAQQAEAEMMKQEVADAAQIAEQGGKGIDALMNAGAEAEMAQ